LYKKYTVSFAKKYPKCPNPSVHVINKTIGSFHGFPKVPSMVTPTMNEKILKKKGFEMKEESNMSFEKLKNLIEDKNKSYPIVSVSPEYFDEMERKFGRKKLGYYTQGKSTIDHTIIILDIEEEEITFFDPYTPFFHRKEKNVPERAIFKLPKALFLDLWSEAKRSYRWAMWIERMSQKRIEEYQER